MKTLYRQLESLCAERGWDGLADDLHQRLVEQTREPQEEYVARVRIRQPGTTVFCGVSVDHATEWSCDVVWSLGTGLVEVREGCRKDSK